MRALRSRPTVSAALLAVLVAGCTSVGARGRVTGSLRPSTTSVPAPRAPTAPALEWAACDGGYCTRLAVPLDDSQAVRVQAGGMQPVGPTIDLSLLRVPARDPGRRIGSLLVNPGGPGASGIDLARAARSFLPNSVLDRFDIVGWDPRGTGKSTPVDCGDRLDYLFSGDTAPDDPSEWQALDVVSGRFADACRARSGELLAHISTLSTVHDMERIRVALGEDRLTFLGFSYGTTLGAVYATLHPDRVRAFVLDGAVDTSLPAFEAVTQQAVGLEHGLDEFFAYCEARTSCPLRGNDPPAVYREVIASIERAPMRVTTSAGPRLLTSAETDVAVAAALYSESLWPRLASALADARDRDGRGLLALFDTYVHRDGAGRYANDWPAFLAISCLDGPSLGGPEAYPALEAAAAARAPRFGAANIGLGLACADWPVRPVAPLPAVSAPTAAPIVVIGTTNDPVTPIGWARSLAAQLGGSARLVVYDGQGHTSFGEGDTCLDDRIAGYLVDLTVPPPDLRCGSAAPSR